MDTSDQERSSFALAAQWASRITTIGLEMVLPGILGLWLDSKLGTKFVLGILGFLAGMTFGVWHLVRMTSTAPPKTRTRNSSDDESIDL